MKTIDEVTADVGERETLRIYRDERTGTEWQGSGLKPAWLRERLRASKEKDLVVEGGTLLVFCRCGGCRRYRWWNSAFRWPVSRKA